jgi:hypothetical protein
MADVRRLPVLVPPESDQARVAEEMQRFFEAQDHIVALRDEAVRRLSVVWPEGPAARKLER